MNNYQSVHTNQPHRRNFLDSLKLKYSRHQHDPQQFTLRQPLGQYVPPNYNIDPNGRKMSSKDYTILGKRHERSQSYSRPELANNHSKHQISSKAGLPYNNQRPFQPLLESIALKKILSDNSKQNRTSQLNIRQRPSIKEQEENNYQQIVRYLDSPIKLIDPRQEKPLEQIWKVEEPKKVQRPRKTEEDSQVRRGRQTTTKTIASIDNILATIREALTKQ